MTSHNLCNQTPTTLGMSQDNDDGSEPYKRKCKFAIKSVLVIFISVHISQTSFSKQITAYTVFANALSDVYLFPLRVFRKFMQQTSRMKNVYEKIHVYFCNIKVMNVEVIGVLMNPNLWYSYSDTSTMQRGCCQHRYNVDLNSDDRITNYLPYVIAGLFTFFVCLRFDQYLYLVL